MENDLITVVVPIYNMGSYLMKAVDSLLKQKYRHYEIILVDDGSTDNSSELCDELASKHEIIRVIHKKNGGLSSARNCGIEGARGKYIIFPDPDDWVDENYLSALVEQQADEIDLEICGNYIVTHTKQVIQNNGAKKEIFNKKDAILHLLALTEYCGFAWNKLYHLDIIYRNNLRFDEELGMAQDLHFAFRYILKCGKISYNPEPHYFYVQHKAGVTNINHPLSQRKISGLKTYDKLLELAKVYVPEAVPIIGATIANQNLSFLYIYYNSGMNDEVLKERLYTNFKKYKHYFFRNRKYGFSHRILGLIALINPELHYKLKKMKHRGDQ